MALLGVVVALAMFHICTPSDFTLVPDNADLGKDHLGLIFVQGAQIPTDRYASWLTLLQQDLSDKYALFIGLPGFPLDMPQPITVAGSLLGMKTTLLEMGMHANATMFYGAHSLGGIVLQDYLKGVENDATAMFLMGSYIQRKYRTNGQIDYPIPTLTIAGELDGMARITRMADSAFVQLVNSTNPKTAIVDYPVVVLKGHSHMQFASGKAPLLVAQYDLKPEITNEVAYGQNVQIVGTWMRSRLADADATEELRSAVADSSTFFEPIIRAFALEGFWKWKPPCLEDPPSQACQLSSRWSPHAQWVLSGLNKYMTEDQLTVSDEFHHVYHDPPHLPNIQQACVKPDSSCQMKTNTVTENIYNSLDALDPGLYPISASEMKLKANSRQYMLSGVGFPDPLFNETDTLNSCKEINQAALDWGLAAADGHTLQRYNTHGTPYEIGTDLGPYNVGPLWIWNNPLQFNKQTNSDGTKKVVINSPVMMFPMDEWIHAACCKHYCKMLSPARVIEWIYVDSLRDTYCYTC